MRRKSRTGVYAILESLLKRRWFLSILRQLERGQSSIDMISRSTPEMPVHVMNGRLRTLLRYGLVSRCSRQLATQNVEYRLTRFGKKITEIVDRVDDLEREFGDFMAVDAEIPSSELETSDPLTMDPAKAGEMLVGAKAPPEAKTFSAPSGGGVL